MTDRFFTVQFFPGLYLALARDPKDGMSYREARQNGWRPYVWTRDLSRAEKFATASAAAAFVAHWVNNQWDVVMHGGNVFSPDSIA